MFDGCVFIAGMLLLLGVLDALFVHIAYYTTVQSGASVQLVFGFEVSFPGHPDHDSAPMPVGKRHI